MSYRIRWLSENSRREFAEECKQLDEKERKERNLACVIMAIFGTFVAIMLILPIAIVMVLYYYFLELLKQVL